MADGSPSPSRRVAGIALTAALVGGALYAVSRTEPPPAPPEPAASVPSAPAGPAQLAEVAAAPVQHAAGQAQAPEETPAAEAPAAEPPASEAPAAEVPAEEAALKAPPAAATPEPALEARPSPAAAEAPAAAAPGFDLVRVAPDGSAAVAGRAAPGSKVTILADAAPVAEAEADAAGNFVALFDVEPAAVPRALTLEAAPPGGGPAASSTDLVMLLPQAPAPAAAETPLPSDGEPTAPGRPPVPAPPADFSAIPPRPRVAPATSTTVVAAAIVRGDTVEVLPAGGSAAGLTLASISYSAAGDVTLAGLARPGSVLRAYVDNRFAEETQAGRDGRWRMDLGGVAGGLYKLRIDEVGADGKVADRVETPFQRDYPHAPPPRPGAPQDVGAWTVQPGNNLWTLARTRYGSGTMYTQIFTANREQIRDPDLIYPGQILNMPENAPEQGAVE